LEREGGLVLLAIPRACGVRSRGKLAASQAANPPVRTATRV